MAASDHAILHDRAYMPTKKSLLELTSQDAMLAQNKLLAKTLETLISTLSNLPQQLHVVQPPPSRHSGGCNICGGAHESSSCMVQDDAANEVNYMGSQNCQGFHQGGPSRFYQRGNFSQGQGWRSHPGNNFNQGGSSHQPPSQEPNLQEKTTKLEELLIQFMQTTVSHQKSIDSAIRNLEVQVGQLTKQMAERPSGTFGANTKKNPKEECKAVVIQNLKQEDTEADKVLQDAAKEEEEDTKREEDDDGEKNNDEVLIPKTKSQLAWEARK
ncbi:hypothetical protein HKD37_09G024872 [Glycine soja]